MSARRFVKAVTGLTDAELTDLGGFDGEMLGDGGPLDAQYEADVRGGVIGAQRIKWRRSVIAALDARDALMGERYIEMPVQVGGLSFRYTNEPPAAGWKPGDSPSEANDYACQICGQPWGH
jgi:hypothetical protein